MCIRDSPNDSEGGVRLDTFHDDASLAKGLPTIEKAIKMLSDRKMPPKDEPRPPEADYISVIEMCIRDSSNWRLLMSKTAASMRVCVSFFSPCTT